MSRRLGLVLGLLALALGSCGSQLDPGIYGTFRFYGRARGPAPLPLFPPVSDRNGNVYTLYGAIGLPQVAATASRVAGGTSAHICAETKGDTFGAHGWVGFADDRVWYWSGDALVVVEQNGNCGRVLDTDPQTNANLLFRAVMPFVRITSTRRTLVALVQNPADPVPFSALVDLNQALMTNVTSIGGTGAVSILGVGAEEDGDQHVTLLTRGIGSGAAMQALFFDEEANPTDVVRVNGAPPPAYGIVGALRFNPAGMVVGLTTLGNLVVFDRSGGGTVAIDAAVTPVGVHRWKDALYLVGKQDGRPVVLPIDDAGRPGPAVPWTSSERAAAGLAGPIDVRIEFESTTRETTWTGVKTAMGDFPFLTATSPWPHAPDTTLWIAAGPAVGAGISLFTSAAFAPVGIAYP